MIDLADGTIDERALHRCCKLLRHRGPDDEGVWIGQAGPAKVGLAHTRLAVIEPTPAGHQPMVSPSRRWVITYNGELYNYRQLRDELAGQGVAFTTETDTEVVLAACETWGERAFEKFNGMWALCAVDRESGRGWLCRDRFGIKPLYYAQCGDRLIFASELSALRALDRDKRDLDAEAIEEYLCLGFVGPGRTIFRGVNKLAPGCLLRFDGSVIRAPARWYRPDPVGRWPDLADYSALCENLRGRILEAVRARTVADVDVGAFLSGGVDSSIVVGHLAALGGTVRTFSIGYADQPIYDETRYAKLVADHFGTEHHEIRLTCRDVLDALAKALDHLSEPFGDSSLIPTMLVSEFARRTVTVALSGDGADELFGGYWRYAGHAVLARYRRVPALLRRGVVEPLLRRFPAGKSSRLSNRVRQFRKLLRAGGRDPLLDHAAWSMILSPEAQDVFGPGWSLAEYLPRLRDQLAASSPWPDLPAQDDPLNRILGCDVGFSLPADMLHKVDTASMVHSLEVRVPMLDPSVAEAVAAIPASLKRGAGGRKQLLIDAHADLLPPEIRNRSKMGFEVPIGEFFRRELREGFLDTVTRRALERFEIIDYEAVMRAYDRHCRRQAEHADLLYAVMVLCHWAGRVLA